MFGSKLYQLRYFFGTVVVFGIVAVCALLAYSKVDIHLGINHLHTPFWDLFFAYFTYVGDGIFVALGIALLGIISFRTHGWRPLLLGGCLLLLSGATAQLLKRLVYPDALRPAAYLEGYSLHFVEGVQMHAHHSFPSGHTTAAFAFFGFLSLHYFSQKPLFQILMAISAGLVGYSRMYLSQHFLEDVLAGMFVGSLFVLFTLFFDRKPIN